MMINGDLIIKTNDDDVLDIHQRLCLPKAELNTKNEPKRPLLGPVGFVFGVQLDSLEKKSGMNQFTPYWLICPFP